MVIQMNNDYKMPVLLIGNSFKYEVESTLKLFFHTSRFSFIMEDVYPDSLPEGDCAVLTLSESEDTVSLSALVNLNGNSREKSCELPADADKSTREHELCRLLFHILQDMTGITPPWGLMTGIRPVKKLTELIDQGLDREQMQSILTGKYELAPEKFSLA